METTPNISQDTGQINKLLLVLEHARADAWLRRDRKALDALLASDFVEINSLGRFSKPEVLDKLFPTLVLHAFTIGVPEMHTEGPSTAVIEYRCQQSLTLGKNRVDGIFQVRATYVKDKKQYRLTIWEITPVP
jgi:hypothetical protein